MATSLIVNPRRKSFTVNSVSKAKFLEVIDHPFPSPTGKNLVAGIDIGQLNAIKKLECPVGDLIGPAVDRLHAFDTA